MQQLLVGYVLGLRSAGEMRQPEKPHGFRFRPQGNHGLETLCWLEVLTAQVLEKGPSLMELVCEKHPRQLNDLCPAGGPAARTQQNRRRFSPKLICSSYPTLGI